MSQASDESTVFAPKYDANGLIGAIIQDAGDGTVLMFAHMNAAALKATQDTGYIHFWSRSRQALWKKGESSGISIPREVLDYVAQKVQSNIRELEGTLNRIIARW